MMLRSLVISLCLAGLAAAQTTPAPGTPGNAPRGRGPGRPGGPGRGGPGGPGGLFGPNAETRLTRQLGLDATQQNTLHTALLSAQVQQQGMREKMAGLQAQLAAAVKAGDEGTIDRVSQDISSLHQQQTSIQAKMLSKVYTSLRADQKTRIEPLVNREMGLPGQQGQRGPAGRGPRPARRQPAPPVQQ
jgi:hypothetical protein